MAGSLTFRLTQTDPDSSRHIALNPFVEALFSVLHGRHSVAGVKGFFNMTAADEVQFDTLVSKVTSAALLEERSIRLHRIRSILTFWEEGGITGYTTEDEIEAELAGIDTGP